jgi:hypothetical protein
MTPQEAARIRAAALAAIHTHLTTLAAVNRHHPPRRYREPPISPFILRGVAAMDAAENRLDTSNNQRWGT